jgi:putative membrane protein
MTSTPTQASDDSPREYLIIYLKGAAMGAADAVPGVSGGTIALITGIYERLIAAITDFDIELARSILAVQSSKGRLALAARLRDLDVGFLIALSLGVVTAIVTVSRVLEIALEVYTALTFAFFFGLIAASAVVLYAEVSVTTSRQVMTAIVGFTLAFILTGELTAFLPNTPFIIFLAGTIAISAMILPGISGSFLLLVFGQYEYIITTLTGFTDAILTANTSIAITTGSVLVAFAAGGVTGLVTISRVIEWALEHYRTATLTFLVSLMIGALRLPIERVVDATPVFTRTVVLGLLVAAVVGGGAVLLLNHYTGDLL